MISEQNVDPVSWTTAVKDLGLPTVLLGIIGIFLWRVLVWIKPAVGELVTGILATNAKVPGLLQQQIDQNNAKQDQNSAILAALNAQNALLAQMVERVDGHTESVRRMSEHIVTLAGAITNLVSKMKD